MELEIRDAQSSQSHMVSEQGVTFGRQGSTKADMTVPDKTVSSRHARIYAKDGDWWLEDLRSSNGTFVDGDRISAPVRLTPGTRFAFCRYAFEVVGPAGVASTETAVLENAGLTGGLEPTSVNDPMPSQASYGRSQPGDARPIGGFDQEVSAPMVDSDAHSEADSGSALSYFFATVPKATAYYMAAIPVMLVNPIGTVRKGIAQPRFGALAVRELIAYALPALLVTVLLPGLVGFIATTIRGGFAVSLIIGLLISTAIAIVSAVVTGFIFHPVLRWIVRFLKGESDQVSRSNYFVMVYTAVAISGIAGGIAAGFTALAGVPFVGVFPIVITLAASLITTWVTYSWFVHFRVMKWVPIVLLILGLLSCIGAVRGIIDTVRVDIARLGDDSPAVDVGDAGDAGAAMKRLAAGGITAGDAGFAGSDGSTGTAGGVVAAGTPEALSAAPARGTGLKTAVTPADADSGSAATFGSTPSAGTTASGGLAATDDGTAAAGSATPAAGTAAATSPPRAGETKYEAYVRRRDAVEQAIQRDPTLLNRKDVRAAYKEMHKITIKVQQKHKVKIGKRATPEKLAQQKVAEKLRDAEVFEQTAALVDKLYRKVVEGR